MTTLRRLLPLALLLSACSSAQQMRTGGLDLDAADWQTIEAAADEWCAETAGSCCPSTERVMPVSSEQCRALVGYDCVGYARADTWEIGLVTAELPTAAHLQHVILHELGHVCGAGHLEPADAVMHLGGTAVRLTAADIEAAR